MVLSDQSLENMDLGIPASMFTGICDIFREYILLNISKDFDTLHLVKFFHLTKIENAENTFCKICNEF